jgi:hypothetical protein
MKTKTLLAGMLLVAAPLAQAEVMPEICKSAVNLVAKALSVPYSDGTFADKYDPNKITLKKNFAKYPMTVTFLGNCDETQGLKETWCQVAGGSPNVYQVDVSRRESTTGDAYPMAKMIVTYNRGGCWVDDVEKL